ncbi:MAG: STAS domain-containing protein [bacterium]|nr:STAS domain-containing protein [bacterium]
MDTVKPTDAHAMPAERLDVAENSTTAYVRVHGRATFKIAPVLRDFVQHELSQARLGILIDFSECESVDSTFVGTLTSLSLQCRRSGRACIKLFNVPPQVYNVFHTLGLTMVLDLASPPPSAPIDYRPAEPGTYSRTDIASLMLDAHQTLAALNDKNALEFRNVIEFLRASLPSQ